MSLARIDRERKTILALIEMAEGVRLMAEHQYPEAVDMLSKATRTLQGVVWGIDDEFAVMAEGQGFEP